MRKSKQKFLVFMLSIVLILGLLPMNTFAATATLDAKPSGAVVTKNTFSLTATGASTLTVTYNGKKISNSKAKFTSSKSSVASVSKKGVVTAKKPGKTTISVKYKGKTKKLTLTVTKPSVYAKAAGKTLKSSTLRVGIKSRTQLSLAVGYKNSGAKGTTVKPISAKRIKWSSSKKSVATVSKSGLVTTKKAGKAVITMKYGYVSKKITIKVEKNPPSVSSQTNQTDKNPAAPSSPATPASPTKPAACSHNWEEQYKTVTVPPVIEEKESWSMFYSETPYYTAAAQDKILEHVYYVCSCGKKFDSSTAEDFTQRAMENYRECKAHAAEALKDGEYHTYKPVATERERKRLYTLYRCACGLDFIGPYDYDKHAIEKIDYPDGKSHSYSVSEVYEDDPNGMVTVYETYIKTPASTKWELSGYKCSKCGATK